MKLGEALTMRSQLLARMQQLRERLKAAALVQEGEQPPEDPEQLLSEFDSMASELEGLITAINRTNLTTRLRSGQTLTEARQRTDLEPGVAEVADLLHITKSAFADRRRSPDFPQPIAELACGPIC